MTTAILVRTGRTTGMSPVGRLGALFLGASFQCWTLENDVKRIPVGTYGLRLVDSPHFGRLVPQLVDVPGRTAIEIHPANVPSELEGCIAVGLRVSPTGVWESQAAFRALMAMGPFPSALTLVELPLL
jgi:hypothetical protein